MAAAQQRRAEAVGHLLSHGARAAGLPARLCRMLVEAWLRRVERRITVAVGRLDRAGLLEGSTRGRRLD